MPSLLMGSNSAWVLALGTGPCPAATGRRHPGAYEVAPVFAPGGRGSRSRTIDADAAIDIIADQGNCGVGHVRPGGTLGRNRRLQACLLPHLGVQLSACLQRRRKQRAHADVFSIVLNYPSQPLRNCRIQRLAALQKGVGRRSAQVGAIPPPQRFAAQGPLLLLAAYQEVDKAWGGGRTDMGRSFGRSAAQDGLGHGLQQCRRGHLRLRTTHANGIDQQAGERDIADSLHIFCVIGQQPLEPRRLAFGDQPLAVAVDNTHGLGVSIF